MQKPVELLVFVLEQHLDTPGDSDAYRYKNERQHRPTFEKGGLV